MYSGVKKGFSGFMWVSCQQARLSLLCQQWHQVGMSAGSAMVFSGFVGFMPAGLLALPPMASGWHGPMGCGKLLWVHVSGLSARTASDGIRMACSPAPPQFCLFICYRECTRSLLGNEADSYCCTTIMRSPHPIPQCQRHCTAQLQMPQVTHSLSLPLNSHSRPVTVILLTSAAAIGLPLSAA